MLPDGSISASDGSHDLPEAEEPGWVSPRERPGKVKSFFKSVLLPTRVCFNCVSHPCKRIARGPRRPTWTNRLELMVSTLRTATRAIPRDPQQFRFWADRKIPDAMLPVGAVRSKSRIDDIVVDWVWPRHFKSEMQIGTRQRKTKHKLTEERVHEWSKLHPVVLYLHGGAYIVCSTQTHRQMVYQFVIKTDCLAVVPNYRRAPEFTIVDAVDDCYRAYEYLTTTLKVDPSRICIMGDSAGGALTVLTMCRIRDNQVGASEKRMPACGVLLSPWVDLDDQTLDDMAREKTMPEFDYIPLDAIVMVSHEVGKDMNLRDPRINPFYANLDGLSPFLIHAGEVEVLRPQIERFVQKLDDCTYEVITDMVHVPHMFFSASESATDAVDKVAKYINSHIHFDSYYGSIGENTVQAQKYNHI
jgi:monoterpene epsilon-lactone hydrolase